MTGVGVGGGVEWVEEPTAHRRRKQGVSNSCYLCRFFTGSLFFFQLATVSGPPLFVSLPTINERATGSAIFSPQKTHALSAVSCSLAQRGFIHFFKIFLKKFSTICLEAGTFVSLLNEQDGGVLLI